MIVRPNGANLIVLDSEGKILVLQANKEDYGHEQWMLPGGGIELGESIEEGAQREGEEETGLTFSIQGFRLVAEFEQRLKGGGSGKLTVFQTSLFFGTLRSTKTTETKPAEFMSLDEIRSRLAKFGLGYARVILQYQRCMDGLDPVPFKGRLSQPVEYPRWGVIDREVVLRV